MSKSTVRRLALMAGAAVSIQGSAAFAADVAITNSSNVNSIVIPPPQAPDTTTLTNTARIGPSNNATLNSVVISSGVGTGHIVINHNAQAGVPNSSGFVSGGLIRGRIDLSGISGEVDLNIASGAMWRFSGESLFGASNDALTIAEGGSLIMSAQAGSSAVAAPNEYIPPAYTGIDFGAGFNEIVNAGTIVVGPRLTANDITVSYKNHEANVVLENLDEFEHSGLILLGGLQNEQTALGTDGWNDDILSLPGAHFIGDDGVIVFDVNLDGSGQSACDGALRNATGEMPVADCLALVGGSTEGRTFLRINDIFEGNRGNYDPEGAVLVDVAGGVSAQGDFVISPDSDFYSEAFGGVIDKGIFFYSLLYDDAEQQHKLVGLPSGAAMQLPLLAQGAHSLWRVSTASALDRQTELRGRSYDEDGESVWLNVSGEAASRDVAHSVGAYGTTFGFDNSVEQSSYAISGGLDILSGEGFVLGLMAGYAHADLDFDASPNTASLDGWTGGAYASISSGEFFLDAVLNANKLILKGDIPSLSLFPDGTLVNTDLLSVGAEIETGWRFAFGDTAFVEPLASLSYVRTTYDDMIIFADNPTDPSLDVTFDDPTSLRAGVGARLGLDQDFGGLQARYSVLGRAWNEFDGETTVGVRTTGPTSALTDELTGTFSELGLGVSLRSPGGAVSGLLNLGGTFGDDYQATTASAGVRVRW